MLNALAQYESAPFNGPFSLKAMLLDSISAAPYESVWVPIKFLKQAQLEIEETSDTFSLDLYGTNLDSVGNVNGYTVTIAGSETNGDTLTLTFNSPNLAAGSEAVAYTTVNGDTATTIAAALVTAINADTKLQSLGITASNAAGVITVNWPSAAPNTSNQSIPGNPSSPPIANTLTIVGTKNGGATETITVACTTTGTKIGSSLTSAGFTSLTMPMRYFKARLTSYSGSTPLSAALQGVG